MVTQFSFAYIGLAKYKSPVSPMTDHDTGWSVTSVFIKRLHQLSTHCEWCSAPEASPVKFISIMENTGSPKNFKLKHRNTVSNQSSAGHTTIVSGILDRWQYLLSRSNQYLIIFTIQSDFRGYHGWQKNAKSAEVLPLMMRPFSAIIVEHDYRYWMCWLVKNVGKHLPIGPFLFVTGAVLPWLCLLRASRQYLLQLGGRPVLNAVLLMAMKKWFTAKSVAHIWAKPNPA